MFYLSCHMNFTFPSSLHLNFPWQWLAQCLASMVFSACTRCQWYSGGALPPLAEENAHLRGLTELRRGTPFGTFLGKIDSAVYYPLSSLSTLCLSPNPVGAVRCSGVSWALLPLVREASLILISLVGVVAVCSTTGWKGCECGYWEVWFMNSCSQGSSARRKPIKTTPWACPPGSRPPGENQALPSWYFNQPIRARKASGLTGEVSSRLFQQSRWLLDWSQLVTMTWMNKNLHRQPSGFCLYICTYPIFSTEDCIFLFPSLVSDGHRKSSGVRVPQQCAHSRGQDISSEAMKQMN